MLTIAKSGLNAAMHELKVLSNNVANASSTGFKASRSSFVDSYAQASETRPEIDMGNGTIVREAQRSHAQGSLRETGGALDVAVNGEGMFVVRRPETPDDLQFTRNGAIELTLDGKLVSGDGHEFLSDELTPITIPFSVEDAEGRPRRLSRPKARPGGC